MLMKIEKISPGKNCRGSIDPQSVKELMRSIHANGLIQPLVVTSNGTLVAGFRRFKAVQMLGWDEVEVVVRDLNPDEMLSQNLVENLHRRDLAPSQEAAWIYRIFGDNPDFKEVMRATGKSAHWVRSRLKLRELPIEVLMMLDKGDLGIFDIDQLQRVPPRDRLEFACLLAARKKGQAVKGPRIRARGRRQLRKALGIGLSDEQERTLRWAAGYISSEEFFEGIDWVGVGISD